jgi:hypothetical protein
MWCLTRVQDCSDLDCTPPSDTSLTDPAFPPRVDGNDLGFISVAEYPTKEEFLTDFDILVFHDLTIPFHG